MSIRSPTCQQSVFKRYHGDKTFIRVLPTRWRQKSTGIDMEQNYATVTLCISWSKRLACKNKNKRFVLLKTDSVFQSKRSRATLGPKHRYIRWLCQRVTLSICRTGQAGQTDRRTDRRTPAPCCTLATADVASVKIFVSYITGETLGDKNSAT